MTLCPYTAIFCMYLSILRHLWDKNKPLTYQSPSFTQVNPHHSHLSGCEPSNDSAEKADLYLSTQLSYANIKCLQNPAWNKSLCIPNNKIRLQNHSLGVSSSFQAAHVLSSLPTYFPSKGPFGGSSFKELPIQTSSTVTKDQQPQVHPKNPSITMLGNSNRCII